MDDSYSRLWLLLSSKEHSEIRISQLAFLAQKKPEKFCNILYIDNIDHLDPKHQRLIIDFAYSASRILYWRTIIPVRPYTYYRSVGAAALTSFKWHVPPDLEEVLSRRIKRFIDKSANNDALFVLLSLQERLDEDKKNQSAILNMIKWTCGHSVRFFLRNINNLIINENISIYKGDKDAFKIEKISNAAFCEAYLCGEDRWLNLDCFDNVFDVTSDTFRQDSYRYIIKLHILFLINNSPLRNININELRKFVEKVMGFGRDLFIGAMNDMLDLHRPLIWAKKHNEISNEFLEKGDKDEFIYLSSIGHRYFNYLANNIYYVKECVYSSNRKQKINEKDSTELWTARVKNFANRVIEAELRMKNNVKSRYGNLALRMIENKLYNFSAWKNIIDRSTQNFIQLSKQ